MHLTAPPDACTVAVCMAPALRKVGSPPKEGSMERDPLHGPNFHGLGGETTLEVIAPMASF